MFHYGYLIIGLMCLVIARMHYGLFTTEKEQPNSGQKLSFYQGGLMFSYCIIAGVYITAQFYEHDKLFNGSIL